MAPSPELSYLHRVVMEIMETEHTYVQDLHSIIEGYLAHIIDTVDLPIVPDQVCALFGNIEDIYEFNSELLQELDMCRNDPVDIARCFVLKKDHFEIYTQYCTNYPNSVAALTDCMRNKSLLKFFMDRQEALKHPLPLGSYLLKPVQRILKYHLLLQEIAKHFDPDESGYEVVEEAINTMTEVAWYINTMKRKHEHAVRLQEVQSLLINWCGPDLTTYGELVLEGTFRFHHTRNNRTLFLFHRVLLITKRRGENFIYKTHISCSMLMLMEGEKDSLCFSVTHYKHPKHPHTVQARTAEEKKLWTHHIKRLILENHHTIIPQKAKEVILDMDPMYEKYRFNWSERKKKTQSDDFTHTRQSELTNQMMENSKSAMLKSVSEGELSSTSGRWQVLSVEDRQLCYTEEELRDEEEKEKESDDVLMEDFSNSMISCWSFRAKALLQFSMDEDWKAHGDTRLSEPEDRAECKDSNTNQSVSEFSGIEQEVKTALDHEVNHVNTVEGSEQYKDQDGNSSEEEVEENCAGSPNPSILPSSVLDKAGAIAEHFLSNARRTSVTPDELQSPQRVPQEVTKSRNTCANSAPLSPREERRSGAEQHLGRRRESILSKKEQLLIDKIRNYYENAEEKDAGFSLKRRESLMFIPSGLVRTSVSHFNKVPHTDHQIKPPDTQTFSLTSSPSGSEETTRLISTESDGATSPRSEEGFRSSAEMIKVWEQMEKEATSSQREKPFRDQSSFRQTPSVSHGFSRNAESRVGEQLKAAEDLNTIPEEAAARGETEEKPKHTNDWRKTFSLNLQSGGAVNQPRGRLPQTTRNTETSQHLQASLGSSIRSVTLSPPFSRLLEGPLPEERFFWPDVRRLRSVYTSLECPPPTSPTSRENTLRPCCKPDNRVCGISPDGKLGGFDWTQNGNGTVDYCVSARAALPNNATVTVLEKVQTRAAPDPPVNEENPLLPSVSQRCRLYEDLDRTRPDPRNHSKTDQHRNVTQQSGVRDLRAKKE